MVFNVSDYLSVEYLFIGALVVVIIAVIVLTVMERRLNKKVVVKKQEAETYFQKRIIETKDMESKPQRFILNLDNTAREFFAEKFGADKNAKYSSLIPFFNDKGNKNAAIFAERMQEALYAGDSLDKRKLDFLFRSLNSMILAEGERKVDPAAIENTKPDVAQPQLPQPQPDARKNIEEEKMKKEEALQRWASMKDRMKPLPDMKRPVVARREPPKQEVIVSKKIVQYLLLGRSRRLNFGVLKRKLMENRFTEEEVDNAIDYIKAVDAKKGSVDASGIALDAAAKVKSSLVYRREQGGADHPIVSVGFPKGEKKVYGQIRSLDDMDRLRKRIADRKERLVREID